MNARDCAAPRRLVSLVAFTVPLAGCIYSDAPIDLTGNEAFHPIADGYFRFCRSGPGVRETCQTVRNTSRHGNLGAISRADNSTIDYNAVPVAEDAFMLQIRGVMPNTQLAAYGLGERHADGSVVLQSPDCRFPKDVRESLHVAGVTPAAEGQSCPPQERTAGAFTTEFKTLARLRSWTEDGEATLTPLDPAKGEAMFKSLHAAMVLAASPRAGGSPSQPSSDSARRAREAIDRRLAAWTASWKVDRYVPGTATASVVDCQGTVCNVGGVFTFTRVFFNHVIPFGAVVESPVDRQPVVQSLCYADSTTGVKDCIEADPAP